MANDSEAGDTGASTSDTAPAADAGNIRSPATAAATAAAWTLEAMRDAEPYPLPEVSDEDLRRHAEAALDQLGATGPSAGGGSDSGGAPAGGTATAPTDDFETLAGGYGYPAPFTRFEVPFPYTQYPLVTIGKVFFTQNGSNYVASAASIGNYAILTAGHVVHAGDGKPSGWSTNLVFVPAYKDGVRPLGTWPASWLATRVNWYNNGNPGGLWEDVGGAVLHPLNGRKISEAVGWLGFSWNWPREQHWFELGYPAAPPFNGERLNCVAASYAYNGSVPGATPPVATGNDMTGGCSGGPWIRGMFSGNWQNGVNSYRQTSRPLEMNSPYFDDRAKSLKDLVVGGNP
jgi:hypothetical protein